MYYKIKFTMPSLKIKTVDDYKTRTHEILSWQIKETVKIKALGFATLFQSKSFDDILLSLMFILFSIITLPFTFLYVLLCLTELLIITILLPLFLVPILRILPTTISIIIWAVSFSVGIFAGASLEREVLR
ncbi:hypothetical protein II906_11265 [bacterium]|nr:hypothetical protein [bacterium]